MGGWVIEPRGGHRWRLVAAPLASGCPRRVLLYSIDARSFLHAAPIRRIFVVVTSTSSPPVQRLILAHHLWRQQQTLPAGAL